MKIYYCVSMAKIYDLDLSLLPLYRDKRDTLVTLTNWNWASARSPAAWPFGLNPATRIAWFSSAMFKQPPLGSNSVTFLFLISCTLTHFLTVEFICLAFQYSSLCVRSTSKGFVFKVFLCCSSCLFWSHLWLQSFLTVHRPGHLPVLLSHRPKCLFAF